MDYAEYRAALPDLDERIERAERVLGWRFGDRALLAEALIHRSFTLERVRDGYSAELLPSNERLEFLGDAIVGLLVAEFAYRRFGDADEGRLTEIRSALVRRATLATLAESLELSSSLYVGRVERRAGTRGQATVLAEAFEAMVAAVYVDGGIEAARSLLHAVLLDRVNGLLAQAEQLNSKSRLQVFAQRQLRTLPRYRLTGRSGPDHESRFEVAVEVGTMSASGSGTSIQLAEQAAAERLLVAFEADGAAGDG